eukprot:2062564-Rhodomonas_salina.1
MLCAVAHSQAPGKRSSGSCVRCLCRRLMMMRTLFIAKQLDKLRLRAQCVRPQRLKQTDLTTKEPRPARTG